MIRRRHLLGVVLRSEVIGNPNPCAAAFPADSAERSIKYSFAIEAVRMDNLRLFRLRTLADRVAWLVTASRQRGFFSLGRD